MVAYVRAPQRIGRCRLIVEHQVDVRRPRVSMADGPASGHLTAEARRQRPAGQAAAPRRPQETR